MLEEEVAGVTWVLYKKHDIGVGSGTTGKETQGGFGFIRHT
jgi:hypothetical protein